MPYNKQYNLESEGNTSSATKSDKSDGETIRDNKIFSREDRDKYRNESVKARVVEYEIK